MKKKKILIPEKQTKELFIKTQRKDGQPQYVMLEKVSENKNHMFGSPLFWTCIAALGLIAVINILY